VRLTHRHAQSVRRQRLTAGPRCAQVRCVAAGDGTGAVAEHDRKNSRNPPRLSRCPVEISGANKASPIAADPTWELSAAIQREGKQPAGLRAAIPTQRADKEPNVAVAPFSGPAVMATYWRPSMLKSSAHR